MNITEPQLYAVTSAKISALAGSLPRQMRVLEKSLIPGVTGRGLLTEQKSSFQSSMLRAWLQ